MSIPQQVESSSAENESLGTPGHVTAETQSSDAYQYITFTVNNEEYGIDIMSVLEIKGWTDTTRLPNQPDYLRGVLNLRGAIVPIIDLRHRFGEGQTEASSTNVVIIVSIQQRYIGILVDAVSDIMTVSQKDIQDIPNIDGSTRENFLSGLVTLNERMVAILELSQLKSANEDLQCLANADQDEQH